MRRALPVLVVLAATVAGCGSDPAARFALHTPPEHSSADALPEVRAAQLRADADWLADELRGSTGLGGRVRQFADNPERARIAVGKAIRRALDRVAAADPVLGDHLRRSVQTGMRCCYLP